MKNNYHCDLTLEGHKSGVLYISQLLNDKLISCSFDGEIKVWSISLTSYKCDHTITKAHGGWINKIIPLTNSRMASCSNDMTIKIWNSNSPYNHIKTLEGHEGAISSIIQLKNKEIILSGSCYDNTLRVWNVSSYQCETIITNIQCWWSNCMLELEFNKVIVGEMKKITVINLDSYQIEQRNKHQKLNVVYSLMVLKDDKILCGNNKGTFCIYDIKLNTIEKINTSFDTYISGLLSIDQQTFISCSLGRNIKVWKC